MRSRKGYTPALRNHHEGAVLFASVPFQSDLAHDESIRRLEQLLATEFGHLDILVHCAGVIQHNLMRSASIEDFDLQYAVDLRMPYLLTKSLLPMIKDSGGQIVFINSSLGVNAKRPEVGQYAATQHALKAIADSLREEVNPDGIRVLTVYPGPHRNPASKTLARRRRQTLPTGSPSTADGRSIGGDPQFGASENSRGNRRPYPAYDQDLDLKILSTCLRRANRKEKWNIPDPRKGFGRYLLRSRWS